MKKLSVLLICAALVGCGEGEVDKVKSMPIKGYTNYTYGKVLDNHKVCEKAEWKAYEEEGIKKVSYVCSLKKGKTSFNFDENVAAKIRQDETNKYIANQKKYLPGEVESANANLLQDMEALDKLKELLEVEDYVKYIADLKENELIGSVVNRGFSDSYYYVPEVRQHLNVVLKYVGQMPMQLGYDLAKSYKEKLDSGLTEEEVKAFKAINDISRKTIHGIVNKEIKRNEEIVAVSKDRARVLKERLENSELVKKEADAVGETAVVKYAMFHIVGGEEVIIWAWNPVDENYKIERQYMKQIEYGNRYMTTNLYIERLIYSATNNITNIDAYMEYYRMTSLAELQNLIYNKR